MTLYSINIAALIPLIFVSTWGKWYWIMDVNSQIKYSLNYYRLGVFFLKVGFELNLKTLFSITLY